MYILHSFVGFLTFPFLSVAFGWQDGRDSEDSKQNPSDMTAFVSCSAFQRINIHLSLHLFIANCNF